jgi:hypothetical protein
MTETSPSLPPSDGDTINQQAKASPVVCPSCRSSQVQRARMVHEMGTSSTRSSSTGVGIGGAFGGGESGIGLLGSSSQGSQQTALAKRMAPPAKSPAGGILFFLGLLTVAIGLAAGSGSPSAEGSSSSIVLLPMGIGLLIASVVAFNRINHDFPAKLAAYEARWCCLTCGHAWQREAPSAPAPPAGPGGVVIAQSATSSPTTAKGVDGLGVLIFLVCIAAMAGAFWLTNMRGSQPEASPQAAPSVPGRFVAGSDPRVW